MKFFSDCSGDCKDCYTSYAGGCLAGHGDDEFVEITYKDAVKLFGASNADSYRVWSLVQRFPKLLSDPRVYISKKFWGKTCEWYGEEGKQSRLVISKMGKVEVEKKKPYRIEDPIVPVPKPKTEYERSVVDTKKGTYIFKVKDREILRITAYEGNLSISRPIEYVGYNFARPTEPESFSTDISIHSVEIPKKIAFLSDCVDEGKLYDTVGGSSPEIIVSLAKNRQIVTGPRLLEAVREHNTNLYIQICMFMIKEPLELEVRTGSDSMTLHVYIESFDLYTGLGKLSFSGHLTNP